MFLEAFAFITIGSCFLSKNELKIIARSLGAAIGRYLIIDHAIYDDYHI